jgi:hypothetical protein
MIGESPKRDIAAEITAQRDLPRGLPGAKPSLTENCETQNSNIEANEVDANQDREEPPTSRPLGDFERHPLKLAENLAEEYGRLAGECEGPGGIRDQLNLHLQRSYYLVFYYNQNPEEYAEFQRHPYLSDTR